MGLKDQDGVDGRVRLDEETRQLVRHDVTMFVDTPRDIGIDIRKRTNTYEPLARRTELALSQSLNIRVIACGVSSPLFVEALKEEIVNLLDNLPFKKLIGNQKMAGTQQRLAHLVRTEFLLHLLLTPFPCHFVHSS